jgi:hypothetical protein
VPHYKIYVLNEAGVRSPGNAAICDSDDDALSLARRMLPDKFSSAEIWADQTLLGVVGAPKQKDLDHLMKTWKK